MTRAWMSVGLVGVPKMVTLSMTVGLEEARSHHTRAGDGVRWRKGGDGWDLSDGSASAAGEEETSTADHLSINSCSGKSSSTQGEKISDAILCAFCKSLFAMASRRASA